MLEEKSLHASPRGAFLEEGFSSRGLGCVPASGCERCLVRLGSRVGAPGLFLAQLGWSCGPD